MQPTARHAFTLVELLTVLSILVLLAGMAAPAVQRASRIGAVNGSMDRLVQLVNQAQLLARRANPASADDAAVPFFGVALVNDGATTYATIIYGHGLGDELLRDGAPAMRVPVPDSLQVLIGDNGAPATAMANGRRGWWFQYGTGRPIAIPSFQAPPINIGTSAQGALSVPSWNGVQMDPVPASPVCSELTLATRDGSARGSLCVFSLGIVYSSAANG